MDLNGLASLVAATASLITAGVAARTKTAVRSSEIKTVRAVEAVQAEVQTSNGISAAMLLDRAEGRRIQADVPEEDRTQSEQGYVDKLLRPPRDAAGNPPT